MTLPPDDEQASPGAGPSSHLAGDGSGGPPGPSTGPPLRVASTPQDALARLLDRRATADGAHAEALLRALVDASPLAMWVLDPDGRVVLWSHAAVRLTGWSADEALGRPSPIVPPEKIDEFRALLAKTLRKEPVVDVEVRRRRKDGSVIDLSLSSAGIVAPSGAVVAVLVMAADLTARKEAEETARRLVAERAAREAADAARERLEESESRFRSLAQASSQIIWTTDADGRIVNPVPAWTAITGQPSSEAAGFGMLDSVHPDDRDEVARLWRGAIATKQPFSAAFRLRVAEGDYRWFAARGVPVLNADGSVREWVGTSSDIHERKSAEAERERLLGAERSARERIERLQAVTASLVDAITVADVADRVVETVRATTTARSAMLALLTSDGAELEVVRMMGLPPEDTAKWKRFPVTPALPSTHVLRTGEPVFLRSIDEMAERFPALVDSARQHGFAAAAILPLVAAGTPIGTLGLNYATPQPFDSGKRAYLAAVALQCAQALERARLFEAEQTARAESERARRDADTARAAAEQASRAKSDFLATMSHELRTPLNAIIGYQNLLADGVTGPVSDTQRRQLDRIGASAHHLLMLIDEVLTLSRVEAGKETIHLETVDVAHVLDEAGSIIEPLATQKHLAFRVINPETTVIIQSDAGKLRQAILNLLSNAVKFTGRGSVTLRAVGAGTDVVFEVRDTGIGIAPEHLERIFEPFWQVEGPPTRTAPGTGLGLAVTRRLAHLLGGDVTVQSAVGEGSVFSLRVPRSAPNA